jgi:hypothetical protein
MNNYMYSFLTCTRSLAPGMGTVPLAMHQLIATWVPGAGVGFKSRSRFQSFIWVKLPNGSSIMSSILLNTLKTGIRSTREHAQIRSIRSILLNIAQYGNVHLAMHQLIATWVPGGGVGS